MAKKYLTKDEIDALVNRATDLAIDLADAEKRGFSYTDDEVVTMAQAGVLNSLIAYAADLNRLILVKLRHIEDQRQLRAELEERIAKEKG